jgi:hypothetical protein
MTKTKPTTFGEYANELADNQSAKDAMKVHWNVVYRVKQEEIVIQAKKESDPKKPRKDKEIERNIRNAGQYNETSPVSSNLDENAGDVLPSSVAL